MSFDVQLLPLETKTKVLLLSESNPIEIIEVKNTIVQEIHKYLMEETFKALGLSGEQVK